MLSIFLAITLLIVQQNRKTLRNNLITQSKSFAALATQPIGNTFVIYKDSGTIKIRQEVNSFTELDNDISSVAIIDTTGKTLFNNNGIATPNISNSIASNLSPTFIRDTNNNISTIIQPYVESFGIHRYNVVYGISYQSVNQNIQNIVTSILLLSGAIIIIAIAIWYFMINQLFLKPVARISQIALLISKGDLDKQIHLSRSDEIGDLANAVDTMASSLKSDITKLQKSDELKSEFLMITSHNLRTPLAIIDGYVDIIKDEKSPEKLAEEFEILSSNVKRLKHLSEDALTISTMEEGQTNVHLTPTNIAPVLKIIADEFKTIAKQKRLDFKSDIQTNAWAQINNAYFHSALWNLLDNAYKFTTAGGMIELIAKSDDKNIEIHIKDSGIGISPEEVNQLFTKFHRGTDTIKYEYEGVGIGLYLTKLIMEQHNGQITVDSIKDHGTTFHLFFPVYNQVNDSKDFSSEDSEN